jgi:hypothetical protein
MKKCDRHREKAKPTKQSRYFHASFWIVSLALAMTGITVTACEGYRHPSLDSASTMSSDTLCYRYAYGKRTEAMKAEIESRNLDCGDVLAEQPGTGTGAVGESRW